MISAKCKALAIAAALVWAGPLAADITQDGAAGDGAVAVERGPVTNLPIPRYVSLKAKEGNVRRGPSLTHRIDWVFTRRDMPLEITGEYGNWRRVRDQEGFGGWVHYSLLSGVRTVIVKEDLTALREEPNDRARPRAYAESGVIAKLGECIDEWCSLSVEGQEGWVRKAVVWGVDDSETRQ